MRKLLFLLSIANLAMLDGYTQNIGINATGATPHPSAMLDVSSTNKGMLIPRTSTLSRVGILNPAKGLMVYDTTSNSFWYHTGTAWTELSSGSATNYWTAADTNIVNNNTGNVLVGPAATPFAKFNVKTLNNSYGFAQLGEGGNVLATRMGGTSAGIGTFSNINMRLFAGGAGALFINGETQKIGIGTDDPQNSFQIGSSNFSGGQFSIGQEGYSTAFSQHSESGAWNSNTDFAFLPRSGTGNFGINTYTPTNKFQIGSVPFTTFYDNDLAIGNGNQAFGIIQSNISTLLRSTTDLVLVPRANTGSGRVGINTAQMTNTLQIGTLGTTGLAGYDIAFGNGVQAFGLSQLSTYGQVVTTTDLALLPRSGNGAGRVGINTATPRGILDIHNFSGVDPLGGYYSALRYSSSADGLVPVNTPPGTVVPDISLIADGAIYADEFDAYSDARIKDIIALSNSAADLKIINALRVTDYTMKDKVIYGNRKFKKVIAQEVEKVYPQVISKHTDFIPNVYLVSDSVVKTDNGYLLNFTSDHHLSATARKLQAILLPERGMQQYEIVRIPSGRSVEIRITPAQAKIDHQVEKVFVYGEEVDDFRTVDYEGLTTLNISASQELSRQLKAEQAINEKQQRAIVLLERRLVELEQKKQ